MPKDPICGMEVKEEKALKLTLNNQDYFFCSTYCKDKFLKTQNIQNSCLCSTYPKIYFYKDKLFLIVIICLLLIVISYFLPLFVAFRQNFFNYLKNIWWAVILGLFLGGIIDYYIPSEYISKVLAQKSPFTILNAVFLGFLMSACSHGILAISIQLYKKGAHPAAVVSFLLASPWANFVVTMMLISLFGIKGLLIILLAMIVAINTGLIFMFLEKRGLIEKNKNTQLLPKDFSILEDFKKRFKNYRFGINSLISDFLGILKGTVILSKMILWWVIFGVLIASLTAAYIPVHFFHKFMGPTLWGLMVTLLVATIIEICSEGSSPLAFEIYRKTNALGNSFVFLMAGVVTDYTEIGLLWINLGRRVALWLILVSVPQVVVLGYLINQFLR